MHELILVFIPSVLATCLYLRYWTITLAGLNNFSHMLSTCICDCPWLINSHWWWLPLPINFPVSGCHYKYWWSHEADWFHGRDCKGQPTGNWLIVIFSHIWLEEMSTPVVYILLWTWGRMFILLWLAVHICIPLNMF